MTDEEAAELQYDAGMYKCLYDVAAVRIEALEADLRECLSQLEENTTLINTATARIEALEAALREFVEAYKHQGCDCYADEMARAYSIADAALNNRGTPAD